MVVSSPFPYVFKIIQNFLKFSLVIMVYNISVILMFDLYSTTFNISYRMFILFSYGIHCIFSKLITNIAAVIVLTIYKERVDCSILSNLAKMIGEWATKRGIILFVHLEFFIPVWFYRRMLRIP